MYTIVMHNMSTGLLQYDPFKGKLMRNGAGAVNSYKHACTAAKSQANKQRCVFAVHNADNKPIKMFWPEHVQVKEKAAMVFDIPS